jgi:hypothetical protein
MTTKHDRLITILGKINDTEVARLDLHRFASVIVVARRILRHHVDITHTVDMISSCALLVSLMNNSTLDDSLRKKLIKMLTYIIGCNGRRMMMDMVDIHANLRRSKVCKQRSWVKKARKRPTFTPSLPPKKLEALNERMQHHRLERPLAPCTAEKSDNAQDIVAKMLVRHEESVDFITNKDQLVNYYNKHCKEMEGYIQAHDARFGPSSYCRPQLVQYFREFSYVERLVRRACRKLNISNNLTINPS